MHSLVSLSLVSFVVVSMTSAIPFISQPQQECCLPSLWCASFRLKQTLSRLPEVGTSHVTVCVDTARNISVEASEQNVHGRMGLYEIHCAKKNQLNLKHACNCRHLSPFEAAIPRIGLPMCISGKVQEAGVRPLLVEEPSFVHHEGKKEILHKVTVQAHLLQSSPTAPKTCQLLGFTSHKQVTVSRLPNGVSPASYVVKKEYVAQPNTFLVGNAAVRKLRSLQFQNPCEERHLR